ncbi:hypothetical protein HZA97_01510 [Candidatus Woesearchaeota archaeon]|nr:hypothetical protein [Candidatus Woesearchaeota archaeon]
MVQNKKKLIDLFVGNLSNAIVHKILEKAIDDENISNKYVKEVKNSWEIAKKYREKINPVSDPLPKKYSEEIRKKVVGRILIELNLRISRGYTNINLGLVEEYVVAALSDLKIN